MDFYRHLFTAIPERTISYGLVYAISVIFTFQLLLTSYSSSTYIEQFIRPEYVGFTYAVAAAIAIVITLTLPRLLRAIGNVQATLLIMILMMISLVFIGFGLNPIITIAAFVLFNALYPQIYLNLDIFLESLTGDEEGTTGSTRGLILSLMSLAAFFSPLAMGFIISDSGNLSSVYFVSAAIGFIYLAFIVTKFRHFYDPAYVTVRVRDMIKAAFISKDLRTVLFAQFLVQFFFTWAVVYFPLYLATVVGFDWATISQIIAVGLLAFVIFEYPTGLLADKYFGEKEMMAIGFVALALSSASIFYMANGSVLGWMLLMFASRFGASLVEVTTESYFFKQVKGHDANLISLFRLMRPLAGLIAPLIASICLFFLPFEFAFIVLAFCMVIGAFSTLRITDTK